MSVAQEPRPLPSVRPDQCQVFCALPLTRLAFKRNLARPEAHFARFVMAGGRTEAGSWSETAVDNKWSALTNAVRGAIAFTVETFEYTRTLGVEIHADVTLASLGETSKREVVSLVAHTPARDLVEFSDAIHSARDVARAFPDDYCGTIDLVACGSDILHDELRRRLGATPRIIMNRGPASLGVRMSAYRSAVGLLRDEPRPFVDAYSEAWTRLRDGAGR